jgi:hypothetical protein
MKRTDWIRALGSLAMAASSLGAAPPAFAASSDWKASAALDYESGDFGTGTRFDTLYVPVTLRRYWGDGYGSLTVPYLSQTSNGTVTNVGGTPAKVRKGRGEAETTTRSGLGDLIARGGYAVMTEDPQPFDLTAVGKVKIPTADKDEGLGTGEFDEGAGLEFGKSVAPGWTLLADVYYTFIGSPPGTKLDNQTAFDAGFARRLREDLTLTALFEGSNALVPGESAPADLRALLDYKLDARSRVLGGALVGLSDGSPDYGVTFGGSYRF